MINQQQLGAARAHVRAAVLSLEMAEHMARSPESLVEHNAIGVVVDEAKRLLTVLDEFHRKVSQS